MGTSQSSMEPGDQVVIGITDMDFIRQLQENQGGWIDEMEECLVRPCMIMVDDGIKAFVKAPSGRTFCLNSDLLVKYNASGAAVSQEPTPPVRDEWALLTTDESQLKMALGGSWESLDRLNELRGLLGQRVKVIQRGPSDIYTVTHNANTYTLSNTKPIYVGDTVTLIRDIEAMKELQDQHGGWSNLMVLLLVAGRVQVLSVFEDGDLHVSSYGTHWLVNPRCVMDPLTSELPKPEPLKPGDLVQISSDIDASKKLQKNFGGWLKPMESLAGKMGKITTIDASGAARVNVDGMKWFYNPRLLTKISDNGSPSKFVVGDTVRLIKIKQRAKALQKDHDKWVESMTPMLGQEGKVKHILRSGDLCLKVMGKKVILNPECVVKANEASNDSSAGEPGKMLLSNAERLDDNSHEEEREVYNVSELELAVTSNNYELCCTLVENGADVNAINSNGMTPIMYAAISSNQDILSCLLRHPDANTKIADDNGDTALHMAVGKCKFDSVKTLLSAKADMRAGNDFQCSAFHLAVRNGNTRILELFLQQQGASVVDLQKGNKFAAIHLAALNNHPDCLRLLIQHQADVNIRTNILQTALHLAVSKKNMECVEILVESKADLNLKNVYGDTPLHDAIRVHKKHKLKKMNMQVDMGEMVQLMGDSHGGPEKTEDIVLYLVQNGANLHIVNDAGKSPLTQCEDNDLQPKLELLQTTPSWAVPHGSQNHEIKELKKKIQILKKEKECSSCQKNSIDVLFDCGHMACSVCVEDLSECHRCLAKINRKIKLYL